MQIDWITVIAQIVNFLILLYLLRRFLYRPIERAMEERRELVAARMREAEEREKAAIHEERRHRDALRELEEEREELMSQATLEAEERRRHLLDHAREEIEATEQRWRENLREERSLFIRHLREQMGRELCAVARQALADLANRELQAQVMGVFIERLGALDERQREELRAGLDGAGATITTAFDVSPSQEQELSRLVQQVLGSEQRVAFRLADELLCGIELSAGGRKVAWSLDSYLDALEDSVLEALEGENAGD